MISGARTRGEGCALTVAEYTTAILYNGLGEYELAFEAAKKAAAADEIATSSWALPELIEAAARSGREEIARESLDQLRRADERERHDVGEGNGGSRECAPRRG